MERQTRGSAHCIRSPRACGVEPSSMRVARKDQIKSRSNDRSDLGVVSDTFGASTDTFVSLSISNASSHLFVEVIVLIDQAYRATKVHSFVLPLLAFTVLA